MANTEFFSHLFELSRKVTPYLDGQLGDFDTDGIHLSKSNSQTIQQLYVQLSEDSPEAGSAYWLTRTWDLLCWQPVYIAFISVYGLKKIPDIQGMTQFAHPCFISGFRFNNSNIQTGTDEELIGLACTQLKTLFERYREDISHWTRIRPGFTNHLLADGLLNCLLKLQYHAPYLGHADLLYQARIWFSALQLPDKQMNNLYVDPETGKINLVRTSCCLVYKCTKRSLCNDCPRLVSNKEINSFIRNTNRC